MLPVRHPGPHPDRIRSADRKGPQAAPRHNHLRDYSSGDPHGKRNSDVDEAAAVVAQDWPDSGTIHNVIAIVTARVGSPTIVISATFFTSSKHHNGTPSCRAFPTRMWSTPSRLVVVTSARMNDAKYVPTKITQSR